MCDMDIYLGHSWHMLLAYGWHSSSMISLVLIYMVDGHGCCTWLAHSLEHDVFVHDPLFTFDISFVSLLRYEIVCMMGIHVWYDTSLDD